MPAPKTNSSRQNVPAGSDLRRVMDRVVERVKSMTQAERIDSLKAAGILTPGGNLAKPYRAR